MPDISASSWNESDPLNNATPPTGWPEGQMPSTVNDCARMMMGGLKRWWNRANPTIAATGVSGAYAYATANTLFPTAYQQGETYSFKAPFTSVGGDTFVVNALTALPIYSRTGSGTLSAIHAGDIQSGTYITLAYDSALNAGAGGFQLVNGGGTAPINNPSFGGTVSAPTLNVSGTGTIQNLVVPGTSTQTGAVSMGGTLNVAGASTLSGGLSVTGNETVSGNLTTGLAVTGSGGVTTGNNFYGPAAGFSLLAPGNVNASVIDLWANTTQMLGNATVNGNLTVNGSATLTGGLNGSTGYFTGTFSANTVNGTTGTIGNVSFSGSGNINGSGTITIGNISASIGTVGGVSFSGGTVTAGNINCAGINTTGNTVTAGNVLPGTDATYYCGDAAFAWAGVESYAYYNASSATLKDDIATIGSAACMVAVERLRPVTFRYKDIADKSTHCGFIAEEVSAALDEAGIEACVRRNGERLSLAYQELIPLLLGTVQALTKRLEALEAR